MNGEPCLRIAASGTATAHVKQPLPAILIIPPLFDEANRLRRTLVLMMHALAGSGHDCLLPDLPGQNDSLLPNDLATLSLWRDALTTFSAAIDGPLVTASWRGGALIDDAANSAIGHWRMAPIAGSSIVRAMVRTRLAGDKEAGRQSTAESIRASAADGPVELAGYHLCSSMIDQLETATPATPAPLRTVALGNGENKVTGSALWLRAEPGEDRVMAEAMAADIHAWSITCAAG